MSRILFLLAAFAGFGITLVAIAWRPFSFTEKAESVPARPPIPSEWVADVSATAEASATEIASQGPPPDRVDVARQPRPARVEAATWRDPFGNLIQGPVAYEYAEDGSRFARAKLEPGHADAHPIASSGGGSEAEPQARTPRAPTHELPPEESEEIEALRSELERRIDIPEGARLVVAHEIRDGRDGVAIRFMPAEADRWIEAPALGAAGEPTGGAAYPGPTR